MATRFLGKLALAVSLFCVRSGPRHPTGPLGDQMADR